MGRSALPCTDRSTVWLTDLIEATEAVAASVELCDPAIVTAFNDRLRIHDGARPPFDPASSASKPHGACPRISWPGWRS
jgi:hypothetical protein